MKHFHAMKSKTTITLLSLLLWGITCISTTPCEAQRWRKVLDFPVPSGGKDVVVLTNGYIISLISTDSMIVVAMDQQGTMKWRRNMGVGIGLVLESIDEYLLVGGTTGSSFSDVGVLVKLTPGGSVVWQKNYERGFITAIAKHESGYYLGGNLDRSGSSSNAVVYKVDANGNEVWKKEYDFYSNSGVNAILGNETDLYLVLDASTVGVGFEGSVLIKANPADGQLIWWRDKSLGYYDNFPDEHNLLRPMEVAVDAANEIVVAAPANSSYGLIYSYAADGTLTNEVRLSQTLPHALHIMPNGDYLIAGILVETVDGTNAVIERRSPAGALVWQRTVEQGSFFAIGVYGDTIIAVGTDQDFRLTSTYHPYIVKLTSDGRLYDSALRFEVTEDVNDNCIPELPDQPFDDFVLRVDDRFFSSGQNGIVTVDVDTGSYDYALDFPPNIQLCHALQSLVVQSPDETVYQNILVKREQCADLSVGITYTEFIRGETGHFYVQFNNNGSDYVQDVVLNITLDDRLQLEAVSSTYVTTVDGIQITLPFLPPNFTDRVRIDVHIDGHLQLFSTICIEASMTPHGSCDRDVLVWKGPDLEMNSGCENNLVVFRVENKASDMTEVVPYELFADGFRFEEGTLQLQSGEERVFNIASGGSTISMRTRQVPGHPFNDVIAGSIEGCGVEPGQTGTQGMIRMFDPASPSPWISRACIEVRDQYSADRIFEIARGLGRYHMIDSTQSRCEFSLMYQNDTEKPIDKFELFLRPGWQFDILTFRELASSHAFEHELSGTGIIKLISKNMALLPGEQVQYRFALDLFSSEHDQDFVTVRASGAANDSIPVNIYEGFYNRNVPGEVSEISPFVSVNNGRIIGRGHTVEFDNDLHIRENGTVLYTGSTHEFGVDSRTLILAASPDNTLIWQHTYAFKEGGALLRKIIPAGEGRFLLIGSIDDNQVPDNFINDAYACMLMLNENGNELWRHVWKPGNGGFVGGSLNNGHYYHEDKIVLLGFRYTANGARQFLMEIDINGDIHWIRDFILGTDPWGDPVTVINDIPMKVSSSGNLFIVANDFWDSFIVKLDDEANILAQSKFTDNSTMGSINQKDFIILDNEELLLVGDGYSYDSEFNITAFGVMIRLDEDFKLLDETIILDHFYDIELNAATYRDSIVFASGTIKVDTVSGTDAVIIRSDLGGINAAVLRIADFGARDYAYNVALSADGRVYAGVQTQTIDNFNNLQMGYFWAADSITATQNIFITPGNIQVFPNPVRDVINIVSEKNIMKANAYSMNGTMMRMTHEGGNSYAVHEFPPGIYLLVVYSTDDTRYIARFVKAE